VEKRDTAWIVGFLILGASGLWVFQSHYDRALPVASLDFKLSRDEAFLEAQAFAVSQGHDLLTFESAQIFAPDMMSQIFLQKSLGLEETNRLAREWVSIFSWRVRWYKSLEKEEIHVYLDPGGRVVNYSHRILDEDEGANLADSSAVPIAKAFAFDTLGFSEDEWDEVERSSKEQTARTDHTFTYRKKDFVAGDAGHYRMSVVVQGDRVGSFREFVEVPESFKRSFEKTRSQANLLTSVFTICWLGLGSAVLVILARRYRAGGLQWRSSKILGIAVVAAMLLSQLNSIPLVMYNYNTTQAAGGFLVAIIVGFIFASVFSGCLVSMSGTAGAWITRDVFGSSRLFPRLSLTNLTSGRYVTATLIGYGVAGMMLGFLILFYYVGTEVFGVWSPAYVIEYDNAFSTWMPWAYPLLVGLVAASMEEFFFRLLAIPLLLQKLKNKWLAVIIPAVVWAFLHSNYPVEPIYTRGIELTFVGIGFGLVFLRWGIWSTIVAHYAYNAFVSSFPMLRSSSLYFQISGIAVIGLLALPVLVAAIGALRGRTGADVEEEDPEQSAPTTPARSDADTDEVPAPEEKSLDHYVLSSNHRWLVVALLVVSLGVVLSVDSPRFGRKSFNLTLDRSEALSRAEEVRASLGWELEDGYRYADFMDNLGYQGFTYLIRKVGVDSADVMVNRSTFPRRWRVRWFKPLEKTEYSVAISQSGELASLRRTLPDSLPGAELASDEARPIAASALKKHFSIDVSDSVRYKPIEVKSDKKENRLDHTFVWEYLDTKVDSGQFRVQAFVQGDSFGGASFGFKAPESFMRELNERSITDTVVSSVSTIAVIVLVVFASITFFKLYRSGDIAWRVPWIVGGLALTGSLIKFANEMPLVLKGFRTSQSMMTFVGMKGVGLVGSMVIVPLLLVVISAMAIALARTCIPGHPGPVAWFNRLRSGEGRGHLILDAVLVGGGVSLVSRAMGAVERKLSHEWFLEHWRATGYSIGSLDEYSAFLNTVSDLFMGCSFFLAALAAVFVIKCLFREWKWVAALALGATAFGQIDNAETLSHGAFQIAVNVIQMGVLLLFIVTFIRQNLLAYFVGIVFLAKISGGIRLLESSVGWYDLNGAAVIAIGVVPILVGVYQVVRGRSAEVG